MAINIISKQIVLDVYSHDKPSITINAIAADNDTRYVVAEIQNDGVRYDIGSSSTVELMVLRPDKVGVSMTGQPQELTYDTDPVFDPDTGETTPGETITYYGVYAELDQAALAKTGILLGQFKITSGEQVLRTEIFRVNNGRALDTETSDWAGEYQGYDLDELVQSVNSAVSTVEGMETDVSGLKEGLTINDKSIGSVASGDSLNVGWTANRYIDLNTGEVKTTTSSVSVSDLIAKPSEASVRIEYGTACQIGTYDKNGSFIARTNYTGGAIIDNDDVGYIRIQYPASNTSIIPRKITIRFVYADEIIHESLFAYSADDIQKTTVSGSGNPLVLNGTSSLKFADFSLSGDASRKVTICGKNIFELDIKSGSRTQNGVTFGYTGATGRIRVLSSGATGTAYSCTDYTQGNFNFTFPVDTYVSVSDNCSIHAPFDYPVQLRVFEVGTDFFLTVGAGGLTFLAKANTKYSVYVLVRSGWSGDITYNPQVEINTHITAHEPYSGITADVPNSAGSEIFTANSFKFVSSDGHVKGSLLGADGALFIESDGLAQNTTTIANVENTVTIGGNTYNSIAYFTGLSGAVCVSGVPTKYAGRMFIQVTDGTNNYYDSGNGRIFNADSTKTYLVRVLISAGLAIRDTIRISLTTGVLALANYHAYKGVTTIYTDGSETISASAYKTTMQENAVDSISKLQSINVLFGDKYSFLSKLRAQSPMVSFIDDDTQTLALVKRYHDLFAANNAVGSYAVETINVDASTGLESLLLDYEQEGFGMLYHCYYQAGDETRYWIKGHPDYDEDLIKENFYTGLRRIAQYGLSNYKYWVTPYGVNDEFIVDLAKNSGMQCLFNCATAVYNQFGYVSASGNCNRWDIPRISLNYTTDMNKIHSVTDACAADKGWLIIVTHANAWGENDMETKLGDYIQYCKTKGFKIVPPAVGFETYRAVFDMYDLT